MDPSTPHTPSRSDGGGSASVEPSHEKFYAAERALAWVRLGIAAFNTLTWPFLMNRPGSAPALAAALLVLVWIYTVFVLLAEPYRKLGYAQSALPITVTDAAFLIAWFAATGGLESPYYVLIYTAIAALAFRYPPRETAAAAAIYVIGYSGMVATLNDLRGHELDLLIRLAFIGFTAAVGGLGSRFAMSQAALARGLTAEVAAREDIESKLRRNEEQFEEAQAVAHVGSFSWNIAEDQTKWSDEMYRIYGSPTHPLDLASYAAMVHPGDRKRVVATLRQVLKSGGPYALEHRIVRPDGEIRWVDVRARVELDEGQPIRIFGITQDITERRRAEQLRRHTEDLERSNRDLEQFAYIASHDLQEPLRMVASYVTLLQRRYRGRLDAEADRYIAYAVEGVERMRALITSLLEFSRIGSTAGPLVPTESRAALDEAIDRLQPQLDHVGGAVTRDPLPRVRGDPPQLVQLFEHLLANAIQFRSGEPLRVHVSADERDGWWRFSVRDNGVGIPLDQRDRVFDVFARLSRDTPGTGMGLALSRRIVERHGGRIEVASAPGQGATFSFTLPDAG